MFKKIFTVVAVAAFVLAYSSCTSCSTNNKKAVADEQNVEFRETITAADTTQMLKLADDCMELLKNRKFDEAIGMLHEYDDSTKMVQNLSSENEQHLRRRFEVFPVLKYERHYFSFMEQGLNDVRYKVWFAEEENPAQNGEPVTFMMFNPVKVDGTWYLCVKDFGQKFDEKRH